MITSKFNTEKGILEVYYTGDIQFRDLIEFGNRIYTDTTLPRKLRMLTDVTHANYKIKINEFPGIIENLKMHLTAFEYIRAAFIQAKPKETAYSMLLTSQNPVKNYYHQVFSTREAALEWLIS
jgi:hypothetical protein